MAEYRKYLSGRVLEDRNPVTYRLLSRTLGVQVNTAKEMLYDFHRTQNNLSRGSVHATYVVSGKIRAPSPGSRGPDVDMGGGATAGSDDLAEDVPVLNIGIVPEEKLRDALRGFDQVFSIHVHSLGPQPYKDLRPIAAASRELVASGQAFERPGNSGAIVSPAVAARHREGMYPASASGMETTEPPKSSSRQDPPPAEESTNPPDANASPPALTISRPGRTAASSSGKKTAPHGSKQTSDIMASFAKASGKKPPKPQPAPLSESHKSEVPKQEEPVPETRPAGDKSTDTKAPAPEPTPGRSESGQKKTDAQKEREAELRRMMDDDDESADDNDSDAGSESSEGEGPTEAQPTNAATETDKEHEETTEIVSSVGAGRRKGKRRVMKKRQQMDEQGYLVTVQEAVWESFSEEEPQEPPEPRQGGKAAGKPAPPPPAGPKPKQAPPTKGQGNIMSFFSKK